MASNIRHQAYIQANRRAEDALRFLYQQGYEDPDIGWHLKNCTAYVNWTHYQQQVDCDPDCEEISAFLGNKHGL